MEKKPITLKIEAMVSKAIIEDLINLYQKLPKALDIEAEKAIAARHITGKIISKSKVKLDFIDKQGLANFSRTYTVEPS